MLVLAIVILTLAFCESRKLAAILGAVFIALFGVAIAMQRFPPSSSAEPAVGDTRNSYTIMLFEGLVASSVLHAAMSRGII